jgi:glycosyltransferase involved in cell wall biosynthesis
VREQDKIIHFHGDVAHRDIPRYIRAMDVGIIPDANPWNAPTKLFEYQSCGIPPVGPDYPGVRTSIDDGIDGLIFPPKDIEAMVDRIIRLMKDPEKRAAIGRAARQRALSTRSWDAAASKIVRHFQEQQEQSDSGPG